MTDWRMIICLVSIAQYVQSGENYQNLTGVVVTSGAPSHDELLERLVTTVDAVRSTFLPACEPPPTDRTTVYKTLLSLRANKASPPGSLPKKLYEFAYEISEPLTHVINSSIESGIFPRRWKGATITPLAKKNPVNELGDLRPLSLTPDFGKILEGFVAQLVLQDIRPNLDPKQYDFKKAFDFVDHTVAVRELYLLGCRPHLLAFVTSFLSDRRHRVRYQDALSDWDSISCGVPQGTRLGPVVFLAIINRLCSNVDIRAKHVDDLTFDEIVDAKDAIHFSMPNLQKVVYVPK
ncbi:uncharacterized protein LOC122263307 [Penaeus japonicus]|uniref:uncharacterized protein LOC122263307 n=1 Tax=Penaeus japonicus TaxID=27405 RepID=UPI001C7116A8|nr:uncharacterized protein LOC122263307 [Penaeus japonicus]